MHLLLDRNRVLGDILSIDSQIRTMKRDPVYVEIQRNLSFLEGKRFGSNVITVTSPDDADVKLSMRRNSSEFKNIMTTYRERRTEFREKLRTLSRKRAGLYQQLFPS